MTDNDIDNPHVANLKTPYGSATLTVGGREVTIDMAAFAAAAEKLGADRYDVLSIGGYFNSRDEWVPDYATVRIDRRAEPGEGDE